MFHRSAAILFVSALFLTACEGIKEDTQQTASNASSEQREDFRVTSSAFVDGAAIPAKYTCDGENISPPLQIDGLPARARSLALIMDNPNAPEDEFVHWVVWNIDQYNSTTFEEGQEPQLSKSGKNSSGRTGYSGPCPPADDTSTHTYRFKVYALTKYLEFKDPPTREQLEEAMRGITTDRTMLTGTYTRKTAQ